MLQERWDKKRDTCSGLLNSRRRMRVRNGERNKEIDLIRNRDRVERVEGRKERLGNPKGGCEEKMYAWGRRDWKEG